MMMINFDKLHYYGEVIYENDLYKHVHFPDNPVFYWANFISFKRMPELDEFKQTSSYLKEFHEKNGQHHVQFFFPPNQKPLNEMIRFFHLEDYEYGFSELYAIKPGQFREIKRNEDIEIQAVNDENFEDYLQLKYQMDKRFGEYFAEQNAKLHKKNFTDPKFRQILAYYKGEPAGSLDVIFTDCKKMVEIDSFRVLDQYQKRGVGSHLQKYVMDHFPVDWVLILVDGEDTPKEMIQKQNYQYYGFQYEARKVYHKIYQYSQLEV